MGHIRRITRLVSQMMSLLVLLITIDTALFGIQQTTAVPLTATINIPLFVPSTS